MNRLFVGCALFGLFAVGCSKASDPATGNTNQSAVTASPSATATPAGQPAKRNDAPGEKLEAGNAKGDVTGAYFIKDVLAGEFSDIDHLSLATIDDRGNPAPLNGFIRPKRRSATDFKLVNPKLNGNNLTFTTTSVGGLSYSFTGTFEKMDNFSANPPSLDDVILRGKLSKLQDGQIVTEMDMGFTYSAGG